MPHEKKKKTVSPEFIISFDRFLLRLHYHSISNFVLIKCFRAHRIILPSLTWSVLSRCFFPTWYSNCTQVRSRVWSNRYQVKVFLRLFRDYSVEFCCMIDSGISTSSRIVYLTFLFGRIIKKVCMSVPVFHGKLACRLKYKKVITEKKIFGCCGVEWEKKGMDNG